MTTTNNENKKFVRVTVNSTLFPELPENATEEQIIDIVNEHAEPLARLLLTRNHEVSNRIWKTAIAMLPNMAKQVQEEEAKKQAARANSRQAQAAKEREEQEKALQIMQANQEKLIQVYIENGLSREMAMNIINSQIASGTKKVKNRVPVLYKGVQYQVAVSGNMPDSVKNAIADSGLDRDAFIEKYRTDNEETEA